jgi:hypothetical protein
MHYHVPTGAFLSSEAVQEIARSSALATIQAMQPALLAPTQTPAQPVAALPPGTAAPPLPPGWPTDSWGPARDVWMSGGTPAPGFPGWIGRPGPSGLASVNPGLLSGSTCLVFLPAAARQPCPLPVGTIPLPQPGGSTALRTLDDVPAASPGRVWFQRVPLLASVNSLAENHNGYM